MANYSTSQLETVYVQTQATFGVIPNASGTASVSGSNALRHISLSMENDVPTIARPDKTGSRSQQGIVGGRRTGRYSLELSAVPSGTLGTVPDADPILQAAVGGTAVIGAGTAAITSSTDATPIVFLTAAHGKTVDTIVYGSVSGHLTNINGNNAWALYVVDATHLRAIGSAGSGAGAGSGGTVSFVNCQYNMSDNILMYVLWSFRQPSTLDQRVAQTCVVSEIVWTLGTDITRMSVTGTHKWMLRSTKYSVASTEEKAGLTTPTFPTEPASPVTNGNAVIGFTGLFVIGASAASTTLATFSTAAANYPTIQTSSIRVQTGNLHAIDTFGSYYSQLTEGAQRRVGISFDMYDDDSASVTALKISAEEKTPQDVIVNIGTVPGSIWLFHMRNVYLGMSRIADGRLRFMVDFGDAQATATSLRSKDELTLVVS